MADVEHPGASLGLPSAGRGSLASWRARVAALILDWAASMVVATLIFGTGALRGGGWLRFTVLGVYVLEKWVLTWLASGSFGQLIARIAVVRVGGGAIGWWRALPARSWWAWSSRPSSSAPSGAGWTTSCWEPWS